jgi:hypothetical protein
MVAAATAVIRPSIDSGTAPPGAASRPMPRAIAHEDTDSGPVVPAYTETSSAPEARAAFAIASYASTTARVSSSGVPALSRPDTNAVQLLDLGRRVPITGRVGLEELALREEQEPAPAPAARELFDALRVRGPRWMSTSVWTICTRGDFRALLPADSPRPVRQRTCAVARWADDEQQTARPPA